MIYNIAFDEYNNPTFGNHKTCGPKRNSVNEIKQLLDELNEKVEHVASIVNDTVHISTLQTTAIEEISQAILYLTEGAEEIEDLAKKI